MPESMRPPSLLALPSYLAGRASRIGHARLEAALRDHELRLAQYAVLAALDDFGPLAPHELAARLRVDRSHVSTHIEYLVQRGWIGRETDPRDRRRQIIALTPDGQASTSALKDTAAESQRRALDALTPDEQKTLIALLTKVVVGDDPDLTAQHDDAADDARRADGPAQQTSPPPTPNQPDPRAAVHHRSRSDRARAIRSRAPNSST